MDFAGQRAQHDDESFDTHAQSMSSDGLDPWQDLSDLLTFANESWLHSEEFNGPTLLWSHTLAEASVHADEVRNDAPVAMPSEAETVMTLPMQWYVQSLASTIPTAQSMDGATEIPRNDMPTFHLDSRALSGVEAVVGNALSSTRWDDSTQNLAKALSLTAHFLGSVADRDNEGFDFIKDLIDDVRMYMDAVARHADPATAEHALRTITQVACNEDFQLNPIQMVELLASGLSFARWDDSRVLAYDALNSAIAVMDELARKESDTTTTQSAGMAPEPQASHQEINTELSDEDLIDMGVLDAFASMTDDNISALMSERDMTQLAHRQFEQAVLFLRHDLLRISGDMAEADKLLFDHRDIEPLADAYAVRCIEATKWEDLLSFIDLIEAEHPNQTTMMFPQELVPYEWDSLRELALLSMGDHDALMAMYRERVVEAYDPEDIVAASRLKSLSGTHWQEQLRAIVLEYADGEGRYARNMPYEHLMISEELHDAAVRYCENFPDAREDLSPVLQ